MDPEDRNAFRILIAKELVQMKIRNNDELKLFEETLDRCSASVLVVTPQGEQYDLADPAQRVLGIAEMLRAPRGFSIAFRISRLETFWHLHMISPYSGSSAIRSA